MKKKRNIKAISAYVYKIKKYCDLWDVKTVVYVFLY